ncbi:putative ribonuclease H protein At1g65750 family [Senna tora]|uniref:Putative ribonuclease H protein At1g65750 family n=1 Tax=Senna tora TaxID=362788 RepID=A0A834SJB3_9FABA|nr:putative ribonuclease H protein At1g65750 family [Senna tora]
MVVLNTMPNAVKLDMIPARKRVGDDTYKHILEKVRSRLSSWKSNTLSFAGRVTLIQSVTSAIPTYTMQTTPLPVKLCNDIEKHNRGFVWGDQEGKRKPHLVSWSCLCKPKMSGGLGLRNMKNVNATFMMKVGWRMISHKEMLWCQVLRAKYKCGDGIIPTVTSKKGANVSRLWRGVTKQWGSVLNGLEWRLGNGSDTKFWHDRWVNGCDALINYAFASPSSVAINDTVAAFTTASGEWDWSKFEYLLPAHVCSRIASMVPPGNSNRKDVPAWRFSNNGSFSVKTAYKVLSNNEDLFKDPLWKHIWSWQGPQRIKSFLWLCGHDKVLSNVVRKNRGMTQDDGCAKCGDCQEDLLHILRDCASIKNVWLRIVEFKHWPVFFNLNLREWLNFNFSRNLGYGEIEWNLHFGVTCWMAWKWRNEFIFNGRTSGVGDPALYIHQYCRFVRSAFSLVGKEGQGSRVAVRIAWVPPPDGWIKVNVDGSVDPGSFGSSACGGVLRDRDGNFLCGFSRNVGSCSITFTELWGVLSGLQVAWNRGFKKVIIETDCLNARRLIYQNFEEGHCSAQLVDEIHKSIAQD